MDVLSFKISETQETIAIPTPGFNPMKLCRRMISSTASGTCQLFIHSSNAFRNWGTGGSSLARIISETWQLNNIYYENPTILPHFFQRLNASGSVSFVLKPSDDTRRPSDLLFERLKNAIFFCEYACTNLKDKTIIALSPRLYVTAATTPNWPAGVLLLKTASRADWNPKWSRIHCK